MRQRLIPCLFVLVICMGSPQGAAAGELGFWRWWDSLSGPGPFQGLLLHEVFVCYGVDQSPGASTKPHTFLSAGCYDADRSRFRVAFGVEWAHLTGDSNLPYAPPRDQNPPQVNAYPFHITTNFGIAKVPWVDFGAGVGFVRFSGEGFGFNRFAFGPRVTIKPLALIPRLAPHRTRNWNAKQRNRLEAFQFRYSGTAIPGAMEASDFGAIGNFRSPSEWLNGYVLVFDGLALLR